MRDEFLAEAQEIVEALSRDLLLLDQAQKSGPVDPDLVNEVFRAVHTLKGVAGMFGFQQLAAVAHQLEDLLDDLRLGRVELTQDLLDVLFQGVETFQRLLVAGGDDLEEEVVAVSEFKPASEEPAPARPVNAADPLAQFDLDPSVLSVLTEYEEHRLRSNIMQGVGLFRVQVVFSLLTIDSSLEDLKARAKPIAEIITYLPSMGGGDGDTIELDVLMASRASVEEIEEAMGGDEVKVIPVTRHASAPTPVPPPEPVELPGAPKVPTESIVEHEPDESLSRRDMSADQLSLRSVAQTVRVDIRKLDHLMNVVGELAIVRSAVARISEGLRGVPGQRQLAIDLHRIHRGFERHLEELQEGILGVRMVPLGQIFNKLARIVRQVAREHDKQVRLVVTGAETEVDKLIVEELSDPLMHIIRNAIDHGIEHPDAREANGKPRGGTLILNAYQKGNHVLIEIEDDGAGMNENVLRETAVRRGMLTKDAAEELSREEALNLIFLAAFSTRSSVTETSGRGVGMDVVKTNISRLGGVIDVQSELGTGTKFTITLPVTLAIISALLVRVTGRMYAIPITSVQEAIVLDPESIRTIEGREVMSLRGATLPLCRLGGLFGLGPVDGEEVEQGSVRQFVVVSALGSRRLGFVVDELLGQQDIVIKALGESLSSVRGFAGATDLGDQRVALVIDAPGLLEELLTVELGAGKEVRA